MPTILSFSEALKALKAGQKITNLNWNGKGMYLKIQTPDENSKMQLPYIYMKTAQGKLVPWIASQSDLLENSWNVIETNSAPKLSEIKGEEIGEILKILNALNDEWIAKL